MRNTPEVRFPYKTEPAPDAFSMHRIFSIDFPLETGQLVSRGSLLILTDSCLSHQYRHVDCEWHCVCTTQGDKLVKVHRPG